MQTTNLNREELLSRFTMTATYLPQDLTRLEDKRGVVKASEVHALQLKYRVTINYNGVKVIETDYSMGIGHIPNFKLGFISMDTWDDLKQIFLTGKVIGPLRTPGKPIEPDMNDVLYCLLMDGRAINSTFEDWAIEYGYDTDSRKAEAVYQACIEIGLTLQRHLGHKIVEDLNEAFSDY